MALLVVQAHWARLRVRTLPVSMSPLFRWRRSVRWRRQRTLILPVLASTVVWLGSLAAGEYPDDHAAFFGVYWIAVLAAVEDPDVSRGYGNPIDHVDIAGPLAVTEATRDTLNFSGRTSWDSTFALAEGLTTATASGLVGWQLFSSL